MRAFVYDPKGAQHGMSWSEQAPLPTLKAGQLLVSVRAAGINPVDYKLAKLVPSFLLGSRPVGLDVSGVVVESQCSKFPVGSKVFGFGTGSVAESVVVNENEVSMKPDCVTFVEAASLATAALTGYQGLLYGGVTEGKTVLVIGASGGCGLLGIQIARAMVGPRGKVGGICSAANAERVRSLGADITLDYAQPLATQSGTADLGPIDCVYDCVTSPDTGDGLGGDPYDVALAKAGMLAPHTFISAINGDAWKWIWALLGWQVCLTFHSHSHSHSQSHSLSITELPPTPHSSAEISNSISPSAKPSTSSSSALG